MAERCELDKILKVEREILADDRELLKRSKPQPITAAIAVHFTGVKMNNALVLDIGQTSQASIVPLLKDGITPSGGILSLVIYTFSDPSATVVINPDGVTALVTGIAASSGPISGSVSCTVTDTNGVVTPWTQEFTIQTDAIVPPTQFTQSIAVEFTAPTGGGSILAPALIAGTPVGQRSK
jgi:hypothetical protein